MPASRQRLLRDFLEEEDAEFLSPKQPEVAKKSSENVKFKPIRKDLSVLPKLRKKEKIVESGAYQRDQTIPMQNGRGETDY